MFTHWDRSFKSEARLSDPEMKETMDRIMLELLTDNVAAERILRSAGILPPIGPLERPLR
jgi:hypothetical protein